MPPQKLKAVINVRIFKLPASRCIKITPVWYHAIFFMRGQLELTSTPVTRWTSACRSCGLKPIDSRSHTAKITYLLKMFDNVSAEGSSDNKFPRTGIVVKRGPGGMFLNSNKTIKKCNIKREINSRKTLPRLRKSYIAVKGDGAIFVMSRTQ